MTEANDMQSLTPQQPEVLVTGGSGFLGRHLVTGLLQQNITLRILSRKKPDVSHFATEQQHLIDCVQGDISFRDDVMQAAEGVSCIYHLAAAMQGEQSEHERITVNGTANVLAAAEKHGIKKVVYISTLNVYQACLYKNDQVIDESFPYECKPQLRGFYSASKLAAEKQVLAFSAQHPETSVFIFRPGLIYGPGITPILNDLGKKISKNRILCLGNGQRKLPLIYVTDVVSALLQTRNSNLPGNHIYNLVATTYPTQQEYLQQYNAISGEHLSLLKIPNGFWKLFFACLDMLFTHVLNKPKNLGYRLKCLRATPIFSIAKAQQELNWQPQISLQQALKNVLQQFE